MKKMLLLLTIVILKTNFVAAEDENTKWSNCGVLSQINDYFYDIATRVEPHYVLPSGQYQATLALCREKISPIKDWNKELKAKNTMKDYPDFTNIKPIRNYKELSEFLTKNKISNTKPKDLEKAVLDYFNKVKKTPDELLVTDAKIFAGTAKEGAVIISEFLTSKAQYSGVTLILNRPWPLSRTH